MNIAYFAPIAYNELKQRPQIMAELLAENNKVFYIEPTVKPISCLIHKENSFRGIRKKIGENFEVIRCNGLLSLPISCNVFDAFFINGWYEYLQLKKILSQCDRIIIGYEGWYHVLSHVRNKTFIYDKMDDNAQLMDSPLMKKYLLRCERFIVSRASAMTVTAQKFYDDYKMSAKKLYYIPNGVDMVVQENIYTQKKDILTVGYVGMISSWFDMDVIEHIADLKNVKVVLVGPSVIPKLEKENVEYIGRVPKEEVQEWIRSFDVCIYPFKKSELLDTINPVKLYEYLANNKPVIAVESMETLRFGDLLYRYNSMEDIDELFKRGFNQPFENNEDCIRYAEENSWRNRIDEFEKIMEEIK